MIFDSPEYRLLAAAIAAAEAGLPAPTVLPPPVDADRAAALARVAGCARRRPLSSCGCDADCLEGRGTAVAWPEVGPISYVSTDDCLRCLGDPVAGASAG